MYRGINTQAFLYSNFNERRVGNEPCRKCRVINDAAHHIANEKSGSCASCHHQELTKAHHVFLCEFLPIALNSEQASEQIVGRVSTRFNESSTIFYMWPKVFTKALICLRSHIAHTPVYSRHCFSHGQYPLTKFFDVAHWRSQQPTHNGERYGHAHSANEVTLIPFGCCKFGDHLFDECFNVATHVFNCRWLEDLGNCQPIGGVLWRVNRHQYSTSVIRKTRAKLALPHIAIAQHCSNIGVLRHHEKWSR